MIQNSSAVSELSSLMGAQLAGRNLSATEAQRLSELLGDPELVRVAVEMAVANEACESLLSKLEF